MPTGSDSELLQFVFILAEGFLIIFQFEHRYHLQGGPHDVEANMHYNDIVVLRSLSDEHPGQTYEPVYPPLDLT